MEHNYYMCEVDVKILKTKKLDYANS